MIGILDYGVGNIGSVYNMLRKIAGEEIAFVNNCDDVANMDKLILPGVGSFDTGMRMLSESGLREGVDKHVYMDKPVLGICLGMQMLGRGSQEGALPGLGYIDFYCYKFNVEDRGLHVPHMGWDYVSVEKNDSIVAGDPEGLRFYFVHSYYAVCDNRENVLMTCDYGIKFTAAVKKGNIYGVQFHPEKSHKFGMWMLRNFIEGV